MSEEQQLPQEQQDTENVQRDESGPISPLSNPITLGGATFLTVGAIDLLAHLGPTGLLVGSIAAIIAARHGHDVVGQARQMWSSLDGSAGRAEKPALLSPQQVADQVHQEIPTLQRSWKDRLMGRFPLSEEGDQAAVALPVATVGISRTTDKYILQLSPDFNPHINEVLGRCILGVGQRGTGKSNLAARLIEQIGQHPIPMFIGDYKQDYITLPQVLERCVIGGDPAWQGQQECDIYWPITKQNAARAGALIMQKGVQLVFECLTYQTLDDAAEIMTEIIKGMFAWALKQPPGQRVPALVALDEAQQFLPQNQGDSRVDPVISSQLFLAFEKLNSVGRSLGFTPAFFTQRVAQIRKEVIGGSELFFLMRQTLPQDLKVYEDLIGKDEKGKLRLDRRIVQGLEQGCGIVYEGGEFFTTHFDKRESEHLSTTPDLSDAIAYYGEHNLSLDLNETEPLPNKQVRRAVADESTLHVTSQEEQLLFTTINKLLTLLADGKIDNETFQRLFDSIPATPTRSTGEKHTEMQLADVDQPPPIDVELERGINAFLEGATSINKLAAALDIKPYYAGPLLERVRKEVQKRKTPVSG